MTAVNIFETRIAHIDVEIAKLQHQRDTLTKQSAFEAAAILAELKNCRYEVNGQGIIIRPSSQLRTLLPQNVGSQEAFKIPLDREFGYTLHIDDTYCALLSDACDDVDERLRWLIRQGVPRGAVQPLTEGWGTVAYAELQLQNAIKERDETAARIEAAFAQEGRA